MSDTASEVTKGIVPNHCPSKGVFAARWPGDSLVWHGAKLELLCARGGGRRSTLVEEGGDEATVSNMGVYWNGRSLKVNVSIGWEMLGGPPKPQGTRAPPRAPHWSRLGPGPSAQRATRVRLCRLHPRLVTARSISSLHLKEMDSL